jgi:murein L,D-transpeptidase YcbB/YkuD
MSKTTVTDNRFVHLINPGKTSSHLKFYKNAFRYFIAIIPVSLLLFISTSYQQNPDEGNALEPAYFSPGTVDSLRAILTKTTPDNQTIIYGETTVMLKNVRNFYSCNGYKPVWTHYKGLNGQASSFITLIERAREYGLEPQHYHLSAISELKWQMENEPGKNKQASIGVDLEVLITDAAFRFMVNLHAGYISFDSTLYSTDWIAKLQDILLNGVVMGKAVDNILSVQPTFIEYTLLRKANENFVRTNLLTDQWVEINYPSKDSVLAPKQSTLYKYRILALNLDRLRKNQDMGSNLLYVNIPAFKLMVFSGNTLKDTFRVIVGQPSSPTPTLTANMDKIIANPVWFVPRKITMNEILPKIKADSGYLKRNGFKVLDRNYKTVNYENLNLADMTENDFDYTLRQDRGSDNSLGQVKFIFSNPYSIYLHDTPGKALFSKDMRAFSHGCVRVQNPERLADYILHKINADSTNFARLIASGKHHEFNISSALMIQITYITCEADDAGRLYFYRDIYGTDKKELEQLAPLMDI